jgi:hypothetical protein
MAVGDVNDMRAGSEGHESGTWRNQDQVVRRAEFSKDHPEVSFNFRCETGIWEATYPADGNGTQTVYRSELRAMLDELEKRLSNKPGAAE